MITVKTLPDGTEVDALGPTAGQVANALAAKKHAKAVVATGKAPTVGYVVRKRAGASYVQVTSTMRTFGVNDYRRTLTAAGFIVTDEPLFGNGLAVYIAPRERNENGRATRTRPTTA